MALRLSRPTCLILVAVWLVSLVVVAGVAAQAPAPRAQLQQFPLDALPEPIVLSGDDVGFRVVGMIDGVPAGRLVIRSRSGEWVEPRTAGRGGVVPLTVD